MVKVKVILLRISVRVSVSLSGGMLAWGKMQISVCPADATHYLLLQ